MVDGVAPADNAFIKKTEKVFGGGGGIRGSGGALENDARVSTPGGATDLGNKNAFPIREFAFIARKPEVVGLGN
jgi:hypothetical protein